MSFTVKNISTQKMVLDGNSLFPGASYVTDSISEEVLTVVAASMATVTPTTAPTTVKAAMLFPTITDSTTGTAVAIADKAVTVAAITDVATAANAIATLIDIIQVLSGDVERNTAAVASIQKTLLQNQMREV